MPDGQNLALNVKQGFNFDKNVQDRCGYVTKLTVGGVELPADLEVKDIENPESAHPVVGVISYIEWSTGVTDPVSINFQVSTKNKQKVKELTLKQLTKTDVEFQFDVYEFDPDQNQFFKSFHSNGTSLKGVLQKQGSDLVLKIADDKSREVDQPENYEMRIGIEAKGEQDIHLATSSPGKIAKKWGMNTK